MKSASEISRLKRGEMTEPGTAPKGNTALIGPAYLCYEACCGNIMPTVNPGHNYYSEIMTHSIMITVSRIAVGIIFSQKASQHRTSAPCQRPRRALTAQSLMCHEQQDMDLLPRHQSPSRSRTDGDKRQSANIEVEPDEWGL